MTTSWITPIPESRAACRIPAASAAFGSVHVEPAAQRAVIPVIVTGVERVERERPAGAGAACVGDRQRNLHRVTGDRPDGGHLQCQPAGVECEPDVDVPAQRRSGSDER